MAKPKKATKTPTRKKGESVWSYAGRTSDWAREILGVKKSKKTKKKN